MSESNTKHTPGPWHVEDHHHRSHGASDVIRVYAERTPDDPSPWVADVGYGEADARLIASAPAQSLILDMLALGIARLERNGPLVEFCFNGMRYVASDCDWREIIDVIGWDRARAAIAKATGQKAGV